MSAGRGMGRTAGRAAAGAVTLLLLGAACAGRGYVAPHFASSTRDHESIAVLPVVMVFTGRAPKGLTAEDVVRIEETESLVFQAALQRRLLNQSSATRRDPIRVRIQPVEVTHRRLDEAGIGIRESWELPAPVLARELGVDAVVRTVIQKTRYLSDLQSFGLELGVGILFDLTHGEAGVLAPPLPGKTHDIHAESALLDGRAGELLWKLEVAAETNWSQSANDVIEAITRKLARKFPYRS